VRRIRHEVRRIRCPVSEACGDAFGERVCILQYTAILHGGQGRSGVIITGSTSECAISTSRQEKINFARSAGEVPMLLQPVF
jgi:hypothetical protein